MVIEHAAGDLTCTVEAGTTLAELDRELARAGQMLALDPPGAEQLTVGEAFDRALFGPRAHRYGLPRDLVLGIRARLPDGTVVRGGGKVVKNVAGYDLPKLFTGAHGALGELLELTLRLHPRPAQTATLVTPLCDPIPLEPLMPACVEVQLPEERLLVRFESPVARELARRGAGRGRRRDRGGRRGALGRPSRAAGGPRAVALPAGGGARAGPQPDRPGRDVGGRPLGARLAVRRRGAGRGRADAGSSAG